MVVAPNSKPWKMASVAACSQVSRILLPMPRPPNRMHEESPWDRDDADFWSPLSLNETCPRQDVDGVKRLGEPKKQCVAAGMPEGVVERLEAVEVEKGQQRTRRRRRRSG